MLLGTLLLTTGFKPLGLGLGAYTLMLWASLQTAMFAMIEVIWVLDFQQIQQTVRRWTLVMLAQGVVRPMVHAVAVAATVGLPMNSKGSLADFWTLSVALRCCLCNFTYSSKPNTT